MPFLIAAAIAVLFGAIEQYNRLKTRPTRADWAWLYWALRLALEAAIGVLALVAAELAKPGVAHEPLAWIGTGAAGPAIVRARVMDLGTGPSSRPVGPATAYEPARDWIAARIDDIGATVQSRWIATELLPEFSRASLPPKDIGDRLHYWYQGSSRFSTKEEGDHDKFIAKTLASSQSDAIKRELIVRRAVEIGAYRILADLKKHCIQPNQPT